MACGVVQQQPFFGQRPRREQEGTKSCRIQVESTSVCLFVECRGNRCVHPSVCPSICPSICPSVHQTDGRMAGRTYAPIPRTLQDIIPVLTCPLILSIIDIYGKLSSLGAGAGAPSSLWCLRNESSSYSVLDGKPTSDENNKLDFHFLNCTVDCVSRDSYTEDPYLNKSLYGFG